MGNSYLDEFERVYVEKKELVENQVSLANDLDKEIELIKDKYAQMNKNLQDKIDDANNKIDDMAERIARFSWFDKDFLEILADLMTTFEGRKYVFQKVKYESNTEIKFADVLVLESVAKEYRRDEKIETLGSLVDAGKMIIIDCSSFTRSLNEFCFYEFDSKNHTLFLKVKLDKFEYLNEFVDNVIEWKISNYDKTISNDVYEELEVQFLRAKEETIRLNYNMRENEDRSVLESRRQERKDKLDKMLALQSK